jgi:DNA-damage-inducible protein J
MKIPNKTTLKTLKETDAGKNLVECEDVEDFFKKLEI